MANMPDEIVTLIRRCEVNEVCFSNDDMSAALYFGERLQAENQRLKELLLGWLQDEVDGMDVEEYRQLVEKTRQEVSNGWSKEQPDCVG